MTRPHKLFTALVLQGALLGACYEEEDDSSTDESASDTDATGDTDATSEDTETTGACAEAECLSTEVWQECTADGVLCCWATGECCDECCGHLDP